MPDVLVTIYRDSTRSDLVMELPYTDLGTVGGNGLEPSDDESIIHMAKHAVVGSKKATLE